jgi:hypothetical protein
MYEVAKSEPRLAARFLEQVLLVNLGVHALALIAMPLLVMPGLPGGTSSDNAARVAYLAAHPWLWRLGWLPWQLSAFMDLLTGIALWRASWVPRLPAAMVLVFTMLAILPDQGGEALWVTRGLDMAVQADHSGDLMPYLLFERQTYRAIVVWGGTLYLGMALAWTWCFAAAGTWNLTLTGLSFLAWSAVAIGSAGLLLPDDYRPSLLLASTANGIGFTLLILWLALVTEQVLRRVRPDQIHGRMAPWRHPWRGVFGRALDVLANSRLFRAYCEWLPPLAFLSDITDVIYVNYLVEADRLEPLVPPGLELQRIGRGARYALFTHLTYRHGHFGPRLLGPLRRLLPSPVHTNWRIYVHDPHTGLPGVYFVTNAINSTLHALAARLLSEGMPMHALKDAAVEVSNDRACRIVLDPGTGSAPDLRAVLRPGDPILPGPPWNECFDSYHSMLAYCVPQDRAFSSQPWYGRITRQEIVLGIPLESCEPLEGEVGSRAAEMFVGDAAPLCFRVARVAFCFEREEYDQRVQSVALRLGVAQACLLLQTQGHSVPMDASHQPAAEPSRRRSATP